MQTASPASLASMETALEMSLIFPITLKRTVGGMEIFLPPRVLSFFMLSLPETQGTVKAIA